MSESVVDMPCLSFLKAIRSFLWKDAGAITVEGVLWVPVYGVFLSLLVDTSLMFNSQSQVQRVVQDVNRLASTGYYLTEEEVEARVTESLAHLSSHVTVETTIKDGTISTIAKMPARDLMAVGLISKFKKMNLSVSARHMIES